MSKIIQVNLIERNLRLKKKTLGWLSQASGVAYSHLFRIKNNKVTPLLPTAMKIAKPLGCEVDELFFYQDID